MAIPLSYVVGALSVGTRHPPALSCILRSSEPLHLDGLQHSIATSSIPDLARVGRLSTQTTTGAERERAGSVGH